MAALLLVFISASRKWKPALAKEGDKSAIVRLSFGPERVPRLRCTESMGREAMHNEADRNVR